MSVDGNSNRGLLAYCSRYFIDYHYTDKLFNFQVDPTSGEVRIRNKLDFEVTNYFAVNILAIDEGNVRLFSAYLEICVVVNQSGILEAPNVTDKM